LPLRGLYGRVQFMYIHELANWPNFIWDQEALAEILIQVRHQQGRLVGRMESIGFHVRNEAILQALTQDVVKSSEIEGEILDHSLVRSSVARHLGIDVAALDTVDRTVEGVVEMILDATQGFNQPLIKKRLFDWHMLLFPNGRSGFKKIGTGMWRRGPVDVISGPPGREIIHFEAPSAARVEHEMKLFLDWFNKDTSLARISHTFSDSSHTLHDDLAVQKKCEKSGLDPVFKAALAHLWFVTIHPFEDGNGRVGRAIADLMLARSENSSQRFYSLSAQIQRERKQYYTILEEAQKGTLDITRWLDWFFNVLGRAIKDALSTLDTILYKAQFWESVSESSFNERQKKMINLMLDGFDGKLTSSKWSKIAKCSQDTAYRDILDLLDRGILKKNPEGGRSTSYSLREFVV
jgi:Fic family protein